MYTVKFFKSNGFPYEEYFYHTFEEAMNHYQCFENDDLNDYFAIALCAHEGDKSSIIKRIIIGFSNEELTLVKEKATDDQFETCLKLFKDARVTQNDSERELLVNLRLKLAKIQCENYHQFMSLI